MIGRKKAGGIEYKAYQDDEGQKRFPCVCGQQINDRGNTISGKEDEQRGYPCEIAVKVCILPAAVGNGKDPTSACEQQQEQASGISAFPPRVKENSYDAEESAKQRKGIKGTRKASSECERNFFCHLPEIAGHVVEGLDERHDFEISLVGDAGELGLSCKDIVEHEDA